MTVWQLGYGTLPRSARSDISGPLRAQQKRVNDRALIFRHRRHANFSSFTLRPHVN